MGIETLLSALAGVKSRGGGKYTACCPAHEDQSPSLTIADNGGQILIHCFAGCDPGDILGAVGLKFADLFPEPLGHFVPRIPKPFSANDALDCLASEAAVVWIAAGDIVQGKPLADEDLKRVALAKERIETAWGVVNGR